MSHSQRGFNFGAGPATLPLAVLEQGQQALINWQDLGMSVVEVSHRSAEFMAVMDELDWRMRDLLKLPNDYHLLWMGVPSRMHFSLLAENFLKTKADYVVSGAWSKMAADEARVFGQVHEVANGKNHNYLSIDDNFNHSADANYFYFTPNETLAGLKLEIPQGVSAPVVADMTSCILSEPMDVSDYACIIAGVQKNLAPSGVSLVIIKDEFLQKAKGNLPLMNDYQFQVKQKSLYATPPTFSLYMALLMCRWLMDDNRIEQVFTDNQTKAKLLYDFLDNSDFYQARINNKPLRSHMNVAFEIKNDDLQESFLTESKAKGLLALKGHRSVGGLRASIYNAMPVAGVEALIDFMKVFEKANR